MKEPFFNDLSITPLCYSDEEVYTRINTYVQVLKFCCSLGFKKVRYEQPFQSIELKKNYTLHEYICNHGMDSGARLILSMVRKPYIDENTVEEERFVNTKVTLNKNNREIDAEGLTCAYLAHSFAIGFASGIFWTTNNSFELSIYDQISKKSKTDNVFCISTLEQFEMEEFIHFAVYSLPLVFKQCGVPKEDKPIHLRDDHGKDDLKDFADVLLKEVYIKEVVNSLPFSSFSKDIIGKIEDDGVIELRIKDSDKGLGLVIRTTAETRREALYMAADIKKKYG